MLPVKKSTIADIYIVNELNLKGKHNLTLELLDPGGNSVFSSANTVKISGGEDFGQLIAEEIRLPAVGKPGYYTLNAVLRDTKGRVKATGTAGKYPGLLYLRQRSSHHEKGARAGYTL